MNYLHPVLCVRGDVISEMSMGNDVVILAWGQEDHTMSYVHPPADRSILLSILILCGVGGWVGGCDSATLWLVAFYMCVGVWGCPCPSRSLSPAVCKLS